MSLVPAGLADSPILRQAGEAGAAWIEGLPARSERCCQRWGLVLDGAALHGALSLVLPVRRGRQAAVLRLSWPDTALHHEVAALRAWDGRGAVLLLDAEPAEHALLLERLDPGCTLNHLPVGEALWQAGRLLRQLSVEAPPGLPTLADWTGDFLRDLAGRWASCGRPFAARLLDRARELAAELGADPADRLIHDDLHGGNVLRGRAAWLAVDPRAQRGRPEMAVARLLWTRLEDIEQAGGLERHFRALLDAAGLDEQLARQWTLLRCLDYWLWGLAFGLTRDPERCRHIACWLDPRAG